MSDTAAIQQSGKLGSAKLETADVIQRGQAVLARLECNLKWETDWHDLIRALGTGRDDARRAARTGKSQGDKYREAMGAWLRCYGFDRIDEGDRSRLIQCFDNLDAINAWRSAQPAEKREKLNHPRTVLAHWRRSLAPKPDMEASAPTVGATPDPYSIEILKNLSEPDRKRVLAGLGINRADVPPHVAADIVQHAVNQERHLAQMQHGRIWDVLETVRSTLTTNMPAIHQIESIKAAIETYDDKAKRTLDWRDRLAPESHYPMTGAKH